MKNAIVAAAVLIAGALHAAGEDFTLNDGREYKNVTVSRTEPDGIVVMTSTGIVKLFFSELPEDLQKKHGYDSQTAARFRAEVEAANQQAKAANDLARARRLKEYQDATAAREAPAKTSAQPKAQTAGATGTALDAGPYGGTIQARTIFQAYARNEIAADRQYRGKSFTIGGVVRSISSGAVPTVELDCSVADKILFIRARFTNPTG
jgi:hypothetical protein